ILKIDLEGNNDNSYGSNGFVELFVNCNNAVLNSEGNLFINARKNSGYTPVITKLNSDGIVDINFGNNGEVTFPHDYLLGSLAMNSTEDLFIIGREFISFPNTRLLIIKMNSFGTLDNSFSNQGIFKYQTSYNSYGNIIHIDESDRILGA